MTRAPRPGPGQATVETSSSLVRGSAPRPGIRSPAYVWRDVVHSPPPRKRGRGTASHTTYHFTEIAPDVRISLVTQVRVDPGRDVESPNDDVIQVDERICVQRRALQELIDREKAFSDRLAARWRGALTKGLVSQRRAANTLRWRWLLATALFLLRMEAKVGFAAIRGTRGFLRSLVAVPDTILAKGASAQTRLASRANRRSMWRAVLDPTEASNEEKGALIVVLGIAIVGLVLLTSQVIVFFPGIAPYYTAFIVDAVVSFTSAVALPIPIEPVVLNRFLAQGPVMAFVGVFFGKMVGSWILFLVGDSLHDILEHQTGKRPRVKRVVDWMQARADKAGFWLLMLVCGLPFVPDLLVIAFAVSGMRFRPYMSGIAIGSAIKYGGFVLAFVLIGPEAVTSWMDQAGYWINPIHWFG